MQYSPKHVSARPSSKLRTRVLGVAVAGGASMVASMAPASTASAASGNVWDRVAACESGGNWSISTGNGYYGGLQFSASSWRAAGGTRYASLPHRASRAQQIAAAQVLLRKQGPGAWPVCSRRAGLTRSNGLAAGGGTSVRSTGVKRSTQNRVVGRATRAQVRELQSWLRHSRTGIWSRSTTRALQRKVGAGADGVVGPLTVRRTEAYIGARQTGLSYFNKTSMNRLMRFAAAR